MTDRHHHAAEDEVYDTDDNKLGNALESSRYCAFFASLDFLRHSDAANTGEDVPDACNYTNDRQDLKDGEANPKDAADAFVVCNATD
jgi:hypothetical protein